MTTMDSKLIDQKVSENIDQRSIRVYLNSVKNNFQFLKSTTQFDQVLVKSIPINNGEGYLSPISEIHSSDKKLISLLSAWREKNYFAYPTQFKVTEAGTEIWLKDKLLNVADRILFLVLNRHGHPIGHLGFANCLNNEMIMEVDNVVRGSDDSFPGGMAQAMKTMINWAEDVIGAKGFILKVFKDNEHAVNFYQKLGFIEDKLIPLRRFQNGDTVSFKTIEENDTAPADKFFLQMIYKDSKSHDNSKVILTAGPSISSREVSYAFDAARLGWNSQWNKYIHQFETSFSKYLGVKHALSTSSCTGALHLALLSLGIKPGDEVIVPDITWVATANAVTYVGATPIFADIDPLSWCLDPKSFESLITEKTKAVIPVHLYGHPAKMDEIVKIAKKHKLYIVEDAAPSIGAEFQGKKTGTFGDFAAFSFQGAKLAVTGEGGMLVTNNTDLFNKVYTLWDQGRVPDTFWINQIGWKYKMSNIQAAIGLGQLERVDELIEAKRKIFSWYVNGLKDVPGIQLNYELPECRSIYWMSSILVKEEAGISRDNLRDELKKRKVDTRSVFPAISQYPIWPKPQSSQKVSKWVGDNAINLPSGVCLKEEQVNYVCQSIRDILKK